jgi:hypothetical protein
LALGNEQPLSSFGLRGDESGFRGGPPLLYNFVYCSRATRGVDAEAVDRIIASARRNNPKLEITGLLFFGGGLFLQWLEGPRANVAHLMSLIEKDTRHNNVVVVSKSEEARERLFGDWVMELVAPEDIREVLLDALSTTSDAQSAQALRLMLAQLELAEPEGEGAES